MSAFQAKELLLRVLRLRLPRLKEFSFQVVNFRNSCEYFSFSDEEFGDFLTLTNQLESLTIYTVYEWVLNYYGTVSSLPTTEYTKLEKLHFESTRTLLSFDYDDRIISEILKRCSTSLRYLYLNKVNCKYSLRF